jgi:8-oxo-dGTP pyrophosphatase MutT (NUDIX family)
VKAVAAVVVGVLSSIVSAILIGGLSLVWRHRGNLSLLRTTLYPRGAVRVSFAALLRVKDDDRYVLVSSNTRPGFYGPLGGVFKYHESATAALDELGFREQRFDSRRMHAKADLRGFVPAWSAAGFLSWFQRGVDRETVSECLRRELAEELGTGQLDEVGGTDLASDIDALTFRPVRTVLEGPHRVPRQPFRQMRRFEVYDLAVVDEVSARFRRRLIDLSADPSTRTLLYASVAEMTNGWCGTSPVAPHSGYLLGRRRLVPDLPPVP